MREKYRKVCSTLKGPADFNEYEWRTNAEIIREMFNEPNK